MIDIDCNSVIRVFSHQLIHRIHKKVVELISNTSNTTFIICARLIVAKGQGYHFITFLHNGFNNE